MKKSLAVIAAAVALLFATVGFPSRLWAQDTKYTPDTLVVSGSVYPTGEDVPALVPGTTLLPPGCVAGDVIIPGVKTSKNDPLGTVNIPNSTAATKTAPALSGNSTGCTVAVDNGEYPNNFPMGVWDGHNVFNNGAGTATVAGDGHFGVTSQIVIDNLAATSGTWLWRYNVPPTTIVTSFSSKSELALYKSDDGQSITFGAYQGGPGCPAISWNAATPPYTTLTPPVLMIGTPGPLTSPSPESPTAVGLIDVSNGNTPGVCDFTNSAISSMIGSTTPTAYYRAVGEVDAFGNLSTTPGNAYSGDNGRGAFKANKTYYMVGNDNSGNLSKTQLFPPSTAGGTTIGNELVTSTGAELLVPGNANPPVPPNINMIGDFSVVNVGYATADKLGKDNNFRGETVYNGTLYVTKGSGGNGINTVYQVGSTGMLPSSSSSTLELEDTPIVILPGFPTGLASGVDQNGNPALVMYPFGLYFANANTLYVCDEGDGNYVAPPAGSPAGTNVADAQDFLTAGVQKWVLTNGTWAEQYILQTGLNIGVPYSVPNYPTQLNPATDGCRHLTGRVNSDGTVNIWAVTSTVSANADQGADPNQLVTVTDRLANTDATVAVGETFAVVKQAPSGEVLRGVTFAPGEVAEVPPSRNECNGVYEGSFSGNLMVSVGQWCSFAGGSISGNVQINGGHLSLNNVAVGGNVQITGAATYEIGPATTIGGNLQVQNIPAGAAQNAICDATIRGNLQIQNNATAVTIGSGPCLGNSVGGNLQVQNNTAATTIIGNTVNGNLQDQSNTAPTEIFTNTVGGNLQCQSNTSSVTGGGNTASKKQGQCATF